MNFSYTNVFRFFFALIDLLVVNIVHLMLMLTLERVQNADNQKYTILFIVSNVAWLASAYLTGMYINDQIFNYERFAKRTIQAFVVFPGDNALVLISLSF